MTDIKNCQPHLKDSTKRNLVWLGLGLAGAFTAWQIKRLVKNRKAHLKLSRHQRILILGAGFGGRYAAEELARLLPHPAEAEIKLVDAKNFLLFTPMLTEAAGGELDARHIISSLQHLPSRITFERGRVDQIDLKAKRVSLTTEADDISGTQKVLEADILVIALGSVPNFHQIPGLKEYSLTMKNLNDATTARNRVLDAIARAASEPDEIIRRKHLTVVVGGAGYTGVETMAAVNDLMREVAASKYPQIQPGDIRSVMIDPATRLLPELTADLARYAQKKLAERGVEIRLKTTITGAGEGYVEIESGERIPADTFIWAGGVKPSPVIANLPCKLGRHGGISVAASCAVPGYEDIWAIGDCAEIPQPDSKGSYAPTAQNATREGVHVARNICAVMRGEHPQPFVYTPLGELALVGKHSGVARVYGFNFSGILAWAMWRAVYLVKMPNLNQRLRILLDWILDLTFGRQIPRLPAVTSNAQIAAKTIAGG